MNKKRLGISIYPDKFDINETREYLKFAYEHGFRRVFSNLLQIKNNDEGKKKLELYGSVYKYARELGFEVILDIDPEFYREWEKDPVDYNFAKDLNASGLRFDVDYKGDVESKIADNEEGFKVELNASTTISTAMNTIKLGGKPENIYSCHNFYPMRYTGLSLVKFVENSARLKQMGIKVAAFIGLDKKYNGKGPWMVNDGLCTLEIHRDLSTTDQLISMLSFNVVDDICIGEQADVKTVKPLFEKIGKIFSDYDDFSKKDIIEVEVEITENDPLINDIIFNNKDQPHQNRTDHNSKFFRSTMPRIHYIDENIDPKNNPKELKAGQLVIVNNLKGRYEAELHIITKDFTDEEKIRNVVGKVTTKDFQKIKWLNDLDKKVIFRKAK